MKLYEILYYFYSATDQNEQAFDAMLKRCRSYMTGNYLASEDSVKRVLNASYELFKFVGREELREEVLRGEDALSQHHFALYQVL